MSEATADIKLDTAPPAQGGRANPFLLVPITLFFLLLGLAVLRSPSLMSSAGIGSAIIVATPLILATYALMASVISGRGTVDLSIGPLIGFINVTLIQLYGAGILTNPIAIFAYAIFIGALYQFLFSLIVIYVRVQPIIVSLSGYLALSGMNLVILPRPGGVAPQFMADWGLGTSIFSPVFAILVIASIAWLLFTRTAFYTHLRLMGSDERAAYTSGVPIYVVRIGAHLISGAFAGLAAITFTALISSGDPSQGTTYTLIAVTALVLGGASLAGGRGGVQPLSDRDPWLAAQVGPELKKRGLLFVGLDVIGDYLTEINVTSPTCLREIERETGEDLGARAIRAFEDAMAECC